MSAALIRPASPADYSGLLALLDEAGLPKDDLTGARLDGFLVLARGGRLEGAVGLERYGPVALLRSLAVAAKLRGAGMGRRLVDALETRAREAGVEQLWLLTTTADGFFARLGYARADRADAPDAIRGSSEFAGLCPASAICMTKRL
jgi:amino-acid N-acetyltransferase